MATADLLKILDEAGPTASVLCSGVTAPLHPGLEVEGLGPVALPLSPASAADLIKLASRAPYGRGTQTVVDLNVRKVWQVDASQVQLTHPRWPDLVTEVLENVKQELGVSGKVQADLYKLLLYEPGGFFAPHRDSEKAKGMFATLVVCLPTSHQGGELVVEHEGQTFRADFSKRSAFDIQYACFFADCLHEVRPLRSGYRLCLVYNLRQQGRKRAGPPLLDSQVASATEALRIALREQKKLVVQLSHEYTEAGLSEAQLKGQDRARFELLRRAAAQLGVHCQLGRLEVYQEGEAAEYYPQRGYRRYPSYREPEYTLGDICEQHMLVEVLRNPGSGAKRALELPVEEGELLLRSPIDQLAFQRSIHEATGNEGVSIEQRYRTAVAVVWSPRDADWLLVSQGPKESLPELRRRLMGGEPCLELAEAIVEKWPEKRSDHGKRMLQCLIHLNDRSLSQRFVETVLPSSFDGREGAWLCRLARRNSWDVCLPWLLAFFEKAAQDFEENPWIRLLTVFRDFARLPLRDSHDRNRCVREISSRLWPLQQDWHLKQRWRSPVSETLALWVEALPSGSELLDSIMDDHLQSGGLRLALETLARLRRQRATTAYARLWNDAVRQLEERTRSVLEPPGNWTRDPGSASCRCADCQEVRTFLASPQRRRMEIQAPQKRRSHLENCFRFCDLNFSTRKTSPALTLVLEKNQKTYELAVEQRKTDELALRELRQQPPR